MTGIAQHFFEVPILPGSPAISINGAPHVPSAKPDKPFIPDRGPDGPG